MRKNILTTSLHALSLLLLLLLTFALSLQVASAQTVPLALSQTTTCVNGLPQVAVKWNNPNNATSFVLFRNPSIAKENAWRPIANGSATFVGFSDNQVPPGTYQYQVQALGGLTASRYSDAITVQTVSCAPVAPAPVVQTSQPVINSTTQCVSGVPEVRLTWNNPSGATSYKVHRNPTLAGNAVWGTIASANQASFVDAKPAIGRYQYQIEALGGVPAVRYSTTRTVDVLACASTAPLASAAVNNTPSAVVPPPTPVVAPIVSNTTSSVIRKLKWGVYTGWSDTDIQAFENNVAINPDSIAAFVHWGNSSSFPTYLTRYAKDKGRTMVIFWEPSDHVVGGTVQPSFSQDAIIAGKWDWYIRNFAEQARAYGGPVILIPFSEMNGNWNPWSGTTNGNTPERVVAGYQHVRTVFGNVPNVRFGWAPNAQSVPDTAANAIERYYPGDAYVDIVGVDGFNFGTPWLTFDQVFNKPLSIIAKYNKPMYVFSFASAAGAQKPAWITDALTVQLKKYPLMEGWLWFNQNKERNWLVWSDESTLNAFKAAVR